MNSRAGRWSILLAYWLVQSTLVAAVPIVVFSFENGGFNPPTVRELMDPDAWKYFGTWVLAFMLVQAVLVFPWQLRTPPLKRGKSLKLSLVVSAFLIGLMVVGIVLAMVEAFWPRSVESEAAGLAVLAAVLLSWVVGSVLLLAYCRRSALTNDGLLTRVARLVFAGSVIETIALIPLSVMVRRKIDCYCFTGTYLMLNVCAALGIVVAGPAFLVPLFARGGRARRFAGLCPWCGYDRAGLDVAVVCPECGNGVGERRAGATVPRG